MSNAFLDNYKKPQWQKKRLEILKRAGFKCERCGDADSQLDVHHAWYIRDAKPWEYQDNVLFCFCRSCHEEVGEMCADLRLAFCRLNSEQQHQFLNDMVAAIQEGN